jgi:NAD-dependent SIR2 family protein deacetylase
MNKPYAQFIEKTIKSNPVFIVGSGLSAGAGISTMGQLASYLVKNVCIDGFLQQDINEWEEIKYRLSVENKGLEEALQDSGESISDLLIREIIQQTWCCISNDEQKLILDISNNVDPTGFVRYFNNLKNSNNNVIHVITTNYDHIIEWSASSSGWRIWDGFHEGAIGSPLSVSELNKRMKRVTIIGKNIINTKDPHLRIYKPHGSLSWFKYPYGNIKKVQGIGSHLLPMLGKVRITPTIITPGIGKYLETHREPYNNVLSEMKNVLNNSNALVFLGFGFNDLHIQASFDAVLRNDSIPKIILAMGLTDNLMELISSQKIKNFIAVQKDNSGSQVISDKFDNFTTNEPEHWTLRELLNQAWGAESDARMSKSV